LVSGSFRIWIFQTFNLSALILTLKVSLNRNEVADKEAGDMNDDIVISLSSFGGSTRVSHEVNEIN
jgi:hypothetical protein